MTLQRRTFLRTLALLGGSLIGGKRALAILQGRGNQTPGDTLILEKLRLSTELSLHAKSMSEVMVTFGKSFLGTPYAANTLEASGEECLVVNLSGVDCVTFVENTLALSRSIKAKRESAEWFRHQLQFIRYRSGNIQGYPSRLHYFSDWIFDNARKKVVLDVTREVGGVPYTKKIDFMSTHRSSYRQLGNDGIFKEIQRIEDALNARERYYLPREKAGNVEDGIHAGDVLAVTTSIQGLDVSHTGLAIRVDDRLHLLHAPITGEAVQVSSKPLGDYLNASTKNTGLMIARPLDPA